MLGDRRLLRGWMMHWLLRGSMLMDRLRRQSAMLMHGLLMSCRCLLGLNGHLWGLNSCRHGNLGRRLLCLRGIEILQTRAQ